MEFGFRGASGIGVVGDEKGVGRGDNEDDDERHFVETAGHKAHREEKHDHKQQRAHCQQSAPRRDVGRSGELLHK